MEIYPQEFPSPPPHPMPLPPAPLRTAPAWGGVKWDPLWEYFRIERKILLIYLYVKFSFAFAFAFASVPAFAYPCTALLLLPTSGVASCSTQGRTIARTL